MQKNHTSTSAIEQGRHEILLAEKEMPGLMALREQLLAEQPFKDLKIAGCLHMTIQAAVFIETLTALGAQVQWTSCNVLSTQDHAAAACRDRGVPVFSWKGMSDQDYTHALEQVADFNGAPPDFVVDDGGDLTEYIYTSRTDWLPHIRGITEQTTTGVRRLEEKSKKSVLQTPCFDVNGSVTKRKFDNLYGCRESVLDGIRRATDLMVGGKIAVVLGYGDVGKGCAQAFAGAGANVMVVEVDPICALQAVMQGFTVCTLEEAAPIADFFVTATGCIDVIREEQIHNMKDGAVLCNIGHFNQEIEIDPLMDEKGWKKTEISPLTDQFTSEKTGRSVLLLAQGRLVNLSCATGHPSFVMSLSFTNQLFALLELLKENLPDGIHRLSKKLDEEVARLHLPALGAALSTLTDEQKNYLGLSPSSPFKPDNYLY